MWLYSTIILSLNNRHGCIVQSFWVLTYLWLYSTITLNLDNRYDCRGQLLWVSTIAWLYSTIILILNNRCVCIVQLINHSDLIDFYITMKGALTWQVHEKCFAGVSQICGSIGDQRDFVDVLDCSFAVMWLSTANKLQPNGANLGTGMCRNF